MARFIECCCTSLEEVAEALEGGASRIELCENLEVGGVTPSESLLKSVMQFSTVPVNVLVRPREGNFVFSPEEEDAMLKDIEMCKRLNVNGVVIGALTPEGNVDMPMMKRLVKAARPLQITFHRAFDCCSNPHAALNDIIALGCDRLLTSGLEPSAHTGRALIATLVSQAGDRLIIMPGGGVRPSNIDEIERDTNASEFHGSAHGPSGTTDRRVVAQLVG